jgi:two-component system chemotaxis response regulator CheB
MIRVMVVDDSPLVRKIATDILSSDPDIQVAATAANAEFALQKLKRELPDVITMDIEMPGMGGLAAIREIMNVRPTPVIVMSAHARRAPAHAATWTPGGGVRPEARPVCRVGWTTCPRADREGEVGKLRAPASPAPAAAASQPAAASAGRRLLVPRGDKTGVRRTEPGRYELVAIGTSTGGPVALKTVLERLPGDFRLPIVVVQHMPPVFTRAFAERLDSCCALAVKEAEDGDALRPGRVLIAPGDQHLSVSRFNAEPKVLLNQREPVSGHRPSVDVLMHSVAREYGPRAIGVIMTGMGRDGAEGIGEIHGRGGRIIAQDAESSAIYGMNREVIEQGKADEVQAVHDIAYSLIRLSQERRLS